MSAQVIDGKAHAAALRERVGAVAREFHARAGREACLAVVLVGEDPASAVYVGAKLKATAAAGMRSVEERLPADTSEADLLARVRRLNEDDSVDGILVQLPLPKHIREAAVIEAIAPEKDVDGFHAVNAGKLATGGEGFVPCTPLGCLMLLQAHFGTLDGLEAVVVGSSNIVGKPMAQLLLANNCTVTVAHSRTRDLPAVVRRADIVVVAIGRPMTVRKDWIQPGAVVIDVGINRIADHTTGSTRLVGDVAHDEVASVARAITPVPGGVGPMTIAVLLRNTVVAAHRRTNSVLPSGL